MKGKISSKNGLLIFYWIWFGQLVSLLGTAMTRFALMIWAYEQVGKATTLALLGFFNFVPYILISLFAGVLVDRWDRRKVMLFSDLTNGLVTIGLMALYHAGGLQIWHLYVVEGISGFLDAFQYPAYSAAISILVPREQYARLNGMVSLANNSSRVFAPMLASLVLLKFGLNTVLLFDIATFLFAVISLTVIRIPRPARSIEANQAQGKMMEQIRFGFGYLRQRPGLVGLIVIFTSMNFYASLTYFSILPAMILARTGGSEVILGSVQTALGVGGVVGGLLMSVWGGPKKRIHGVLASGAISFLLGDFLLATGRNVTTWVIAAILSAVFIPFISGSGQAIFQEKVPHDLQGRIFSIKDMLQQTVMPLGYLASGLLADHVFEPAMQAGGTLAPYFGWLVGTGPGAGIGAMFIFTCVFGTVSCLLGYLYRPLREVEADLPNPAVVLEPAAAD